jgi:hypothetical protein
MSTITFDTGVEFAKGTPAGMYSIIFNAVDGKFNNAAIATFTVK